MTEADLLSDIDPVSLRRDDSNMSEATTPLWVYVAGPMRKIAEFNFPAFEAATAQLRALGYKVISPAEQDLGRGFDPTGLTGHEDLSSLGFDLREALISDLNFVAFQSDAICLLPGWEDSKGARAELALARALGLEVGTLDKWLSDEEEPISEHEFLTGELPPGLIDLVPEVWASAYDQAARDRNATLDRLDHFLTSSSELRDLREHYDNTDMSTMIELAKFDTAFWDRDKEVRVTSNTGGQKGTKLARFELFPPRPLWAVAELYGYGASKYGEARNWERGHDWSLSYAAMQRHANLFWSREDDDPETSLPHLAAVVFHALSLMEYRTTHPEFDDRPEVSK